MMVEERDKGCLTEFEKKGLHQETEILENYGIDSETDVSVFDQDDLSKLVFSGLKSLDAKKPLDAKIEVMKTEFRWYQSLTDSIKSFEERKDTKGKDTFDLSDWWNSNCVTLPGFAYVLRKVLTNSPNSCPAECLVSIFNTTYNDDQKKSHADYIELSMHSQFNKRDL